MNLLQSGRQKLGAVSSQQANPDDPEIISSGESLEKEEDAPQAVSSPNWSAGHYSSEATADSPKGKTATPEDEATQEEEVSSPGKAPSDTTPLEEMAVDQPPGGEAAEDLVVSAAKEAPTPVLMLKETEEVSVATPTRAVMPSVSVSASKSGSVKDALERILKKRISTSS